MQLTTLASFLLIIVRISVLLSSEMSSYVAHGNEQIITDPIRASDLNLVIHEGDLLTVANVTFTGDSSLTISGQPSNTVTRIENLTFLNGGTFSFKVDTSALDFSVYVCNIVVKEVGESSALVSILVSLDVGVVVENCRITISDITSHDGVELDLDTSPVRFVQGEASTFAHSYLSITNITHTGRLGVQINDGGAEWIGSTLNVAGVYIWPNLYEPLTGVSFVLSAGSESNTAIIQDVWSISNGVNIHFQSQSSDTIIHNNTFICRNIAAYGECSVLVSADNYAETNVAITIFNSSFFIEHISLEKQINLDQGAAIKFDFPTTNITRNHFSIFNVTTIGYKTMGVSLHTPTIYEYNTHIFEDISALSIAIIPRPEVVGLDLHIECDKCDGNTFLQNNINVKSSSSSSSSVSGIRYDFKTQSLSNITITATNITVIGDIGVGISLTFNYDTTVSGFSWILTNVSSKGPTVKGVQIFLASIHISHSVFKLHKLNIESETKDCIEISTSDGGGKASLNRSAWEILDSNCWTNGIGINSVWKVSHEYTTFVVQNFSRRFTDEGSLDAGEDDILAAVYIYRESDNGHGNMIDISDIVSSGQGVRIEATMSLQGDVVEIKNIQIESAAVTTFGVRVTLATRQLQLLQLPGFRYTVANVQLLPLSLALLGGVSIMTKFMLQTPYYTFGAEVHISNIYENLFAEALHFIIEGNLQDSLVVIENVTGPTRLTFGIWNNNTLLLSDFREDSDKGSDLHFGNGLLSSSRTNITNSLLSLLNLSSFAMTNSSLVVQGATFSKGIHMEDSVTVGDFSDLKFLDVTSNSGVTFAGCVQKGSRLEFWSFIAEFLRFDTTISGTTDNATLIIIAKSIIENNNPTLSILNIPALSFNRGIGPNVMVLVWKTYLNSYNSSVLIAETVGANVHLSFIVNQLGNRNASLLCVDIQQSVGADREIEFWGNTFHGGSLRANTTATNLLFVNNALPDTSFAFQSNMVFSACNTYLDNYPCESSVMALRCTLAISVFNQLSTPRRSSVTNGTVVPCHLEDYGRWMVSQNANKTISDTPSLSPSAPTDSYSGSPIYTVSGEPNVITRNVNNTRTELLSQLLTPRSSSSPTTSPSNSNSKSLNWTRTPGSQSELVSDSTLHSTQTLASSLSVTASVAIQTATFPQASSVSVTASAAIQTVTSRIQPTSPPSIRPVPAVTSASHTVASVAGVIVSITAVASATGGQLGVANAIARMSNCDESEENDDDLPILVHPLRFSLGAGHVGAHAAAAVSNTLLIPLAIGLVARWPILWAMRAYKGIDHGQALTFIGWPSLLVLPFSALAEGTGLSVVRSLMSGEPLGIFAGLAGLAALSAFVGMWVWVLLRVIPRQNLKLEHVERPVNAKWVVTPMKRWAPTGGRKSLSEDILESYSNVLGGKRLYLAELVSFLCSIVVGIAEAIPASTGCEARAVIAVVAAVAQCICNVLTLIPFELFLQSLLSLCVAPLSLIATTKVFDKSSMDEGLESALGVFSMVGNVVGIALMVLSILVGVLDMLTVSRTRNAADDKPIDPMSDHTDFELLCDELSSRTSEPRDILEEESLNSVSSDFPPPLPLPQGPPPPQWQVDLLDEIDQMTEERLTTERKIRTEKLLASTASFSL